MDAEFVRERITQLRVRKDVSEYKMSYDLPATAAAISITFPPAKRCRP